MSASYLSPLPPGHSRGVVAAGQAALSHTARAAGWLRPPAEGPQGCQLQGSTSEGKLTSGERV